jgi:hypothetical protein
MILIKVPLVITALLLIYSLNIFSSRTTKQVGAEVFWRSSVTISAGTPDILTEVLMVFIGLFRQIFGQYLS